jgi:F0F1-type ATP synthase membrane subunit b/b'
MEEEFANRREKSLDNMIDSVKRLQEMLSTMQDDLMKRITDAERENESILRHDSLFERQEWRRLGRIDIN